jgi:hypothetical protein
VSFAAITPCVASQCLFLLLFVSLSTQSGNFWIYPRISEGIDDFESLNSGEFVGRN